MAIQNNDPLMLVLKLSSSELKNILQLNEAKNVIININDALHDDVCSGYYAIIDWEVDEEDEDQVTIATAPLKGSNAVQLFSPEALINSDLLTNPGISPAT